MTASTMPIIANANPRRLGLARSRVPFGICAAGSPVVGPVLRLLSGVVDVLGSKLVSISFDNGPEPNFAVSVSPPNEPEALINAVPSERQKVSVSSASTRLHVGQCFIFVAQPASLRSFLRTAWRRNENNGLHYFGNPTRLSKAAKRASSRNGSINGSTLRSGT